MIVVLLAQILYARNKHLAEEKARIGEELSVATQIQADMLPRIFPPFPDRKEFDIYATMEGIRFREHEFELHPGDSLFVYTDIVPEETDSTDELFGTERMLSALNRNPAASPQELLRNDDLSEF